MYFLLIGFRFTDDPLSCFLLRPRRGVNRLAAQGYWGSSRMALPILAGFGVPLRGMPGDEKKEHRRKGQEPREGGKKEGKDGEGSVLKVTSS